MGSPISNPSPEIRIRGCPELVLVWRGSESRFVAEPGAVFSVGLERGSDLVVPGTYASRIHASLRWHRNEFQLIDHDLLSHLDVLRIVLEPQSEKSSLFVIELELLLLSLLLQFRTLFFDDRTKLLRGQLFKPLFASVLVLFCRGFLLRRTFLFLVR